MNISSIKKKKKYKLYGTRTTEQIQRSIRCTRLKKHNLMSYFCLSLIYEPHWRNLMGVQILDHIATQGYDPQRMGVVANQLVEGKLRPEIYIQSLSMPVRFLPLGSAFAELNIPIYTPPDKTFKMPPHSLYALCRMLWERPFMHSQAVFPGTRLLQGLHVDFHVAERYKQMICCGMFLAMFRAFADIAGVAIRFPLFDRFLDECRKELVRMEIDV